MKVVREQMTEQYMIAKTVPGTRSFHCFIPINQFCIGTKQVLEEDAFEIMFNFSDEAKCQGITIYSMLI